MLVGLSNRLESPAGQLYDGGIVSTIKKSLLITAVAGTGKSAVCKALQSLGYQAIDIESIDGLYELVDEKTGEIIPGNLEQISEGVSWNCNTSKLEELVRAQASDLVFYCGGMSNTEDVWDVFDAVIMLTVSDVTTTKRLATRRLGEFGSTKTNRDWVLSWKHDLEAAWLERGCMRVSAEADPEQVARDIVERATNLG